LLETSSPKEKAGGKKQCHTQPMRNEGCMLSRLGAKHWGEHNVEALFMKAITDVTPQRMVIRLKATWEEQPWRGNWNMMTET
jgi:hypothetical protein